MNQILREQFVRMYKQPILKEVRESFVQRYQGVAFPPIPGSLTPKTTEPQPRDSGQEQILLQGEDDIGSLITSTDIVGASLFEGDGKDKANPGSERELLDLDLVKQSKYFFA